MSCVILFIANGVAPAFRFCLDNSTLTQFLPIRYSFFLLSHIIVSPTGLFALSEKMRMTQAKNCDIIYVGRAIFKDISPMSSLIL